MYAYVIVNLIELACFPCQFFALVKRLTAYVVWRWQGFTFVMFFGGSLAFVSNLHATVEEINSQILLWVWKMCSGY